MIPIGNRGGGESEEEEGQGAENTEGAEGETSGVFVGEDLPKNYHERLREAREKIKGLLGKTVTKDSFVWTVIEEHHSDDLPDNNAQFLGVKGIELHRLDRNIIFSTLFLHLMFRDWRASLQKMNAAISYHNEEESENNINLFTESEFVIGFALMIGASCYSDQGKLLWLIDGLHFFFLLMFLFFRLQPLDYRWWCKKRER